MKFINLCNTETLGKLVIGLLLQVVSIQTDKPLLANIATNLDRNKQEAAKVQKKKQVEKKDKNKRGTTK